MSVELQSISQYKNQVEELQRLLKEKETQLNVPQDSEELKIRIHQLEKADEDSRSKIIELTEAGIESHKKFQEFGVLIEKLETQFNQEDLKVKQLTADK